MMARRSEWSLKRTKGSSMPKKVPPGFLSLGVLLLLAAGCIPVPTVDDEAGKNKRPLRNVHLEMSAGPIGDRLLVTNHSTEPWENIVMVVNQGDGGGHKLTIKNFAAGASLHFGLNAYRNAANERYDTENSYVATLNVSADTPVGPGTWSAKYPKPRSKR